MRTKWDVTKRTITHTFESPDEYVAYVEMFADFVESFLKRPKVIPV